MVRWKKDSHMIFDSNNIYNDLGNCWIDLKAKKKMR